MTTAPMRREAKRVLLVCPVGNEIGGAEGVMLAIGRELPKYGYTPILASMRPGRLTEVARSQGLIAQTFDVNYRYRNLRVVLRASRWLADLTRSMGADVIHATHTAHVQAAIASRWTGVPEVWHLHDPPTKFDPIDRLFRWFRPAYSIFTTHAVAGGYPNLWRGPHGVIAPSCIDPAYLRGQPSCGDIRGRLRLPPEGPLLVTVARLQEHKGHLDLIAAAADVLREVPTATFAIVGKASTPDQEEYRRRLLSECDRFGVSDRVRLVGYVDDADLASIYAQATALVHPAWSEGYGLVLLEAMGLGLPVIAAAATGPSEIIQDGVNGLLTPTKNGARLADAVLRLLRDTPLRNALRRNGLETSERLSLPSMMRQITAVYARITN